MNKKREKKWVITDYNAIIIMVSCIILYSSLYFNNTFPISEGWNVNFAELFLRGKVPYRDFYYYLPPLNIIIDVIFWKLSFGLLLVYRGWWVLQRIVIYILIYRLLRKYFGIIPTFLSCIISSILCTADVYDLLGDYNQTAELMAVLLLIFASAFVDEKIIKKRYRWIFGAGVMLGLSFLVKQTIFASSAIVYFVALVFLCIKEKDKKFWLYCVLVIIGALIPIGVAVILLGSNGALIPFFEQVFINVDGKGSIWSLLVESLVKILLKPQIWGLVSVMFVIYYLFSTDKNEIIMEKNKSWLIYGLLYAVVVVSIVTYYKADFFCFLNAVTFSKKVMFAEIILLIPIVIYGLYFCYYKKKGSSVAKLGCLLFLIIGMSMAAFLSDGIKYELSNSGIFSSIKTIYILILICIIFIIISSYFELVNNGQQLFILSMGALNLLYTATMTAAGGELPSYGVSISMCLVLCFVFSSHFCCKLMGDLYKGIFIVGAVVLMMSCVTQKCICSYSWWGTNESPIDEKTYSVDIEAMRGIRLSLKEKEMYEGISKLIEENTSEDDVIWGYPYVKIFNILTNRYNMNTFVPVLFYDVVADKYVLEEKELLKDNLPKIIIWKDIPYCKEVHEEVFRDGKLLKQREIEEAFQTILPEKYEVLGVFEDVTVYCLKD